MEKKVKTLVGNVVSDKMDKTVGISMEISKSHPQYKKIIRRRIKLTAHDENNACHLGDTVRISETRPISKTKRWRIVEIISSKKEVVSAKTELGEEKG